MSVVWQSDLIFAFARFVVSAPKKPLLQSKKMMEDTIFVIVVGVVAMVSVLLMACIPMCIRGFRIAKGKEDKVDPQGLFVSPDVSDVFYHVSAGISFNRGSEVDIWRVSEQTPTPATPPPPPPRFTPELGISSFMAVRSTPPLTFMSTPPTQPAPAAPSINFRPLPEQLLLMKSQLKHTPSP